jgi:hypothetical protein
MPKEPPFLKAKAAPPIGRGGSNPRGIWQRREHKDDPETWETHEPLDEGGQTSRPKARETGAGAEGPWESEGCIGAEKAANGRQPEPSEQRQPVS